MQVHTFLADSIVDAVTQIRDTLGVEAVVLNVRRPPVEGLARLWQKPRIEVLAHVPEKTPAPAQPDVQISALAEMRQELRDIRQKLDAPAPATMNHETEVAYEVRRPSAFCFGDDGWHVGALLENSGLLPVHAERIVDELRVAHGDIAPENFAEEIELTRRALANHWKPARANAAGTHVFIGAPGAGKTTALCKWLAQVALVEGRSAAVWRLDGHVANTAESLSVFGEILDVPVERFSPANGETPEAEVLFVDLPGVNPADSVAVAHLARRIASLPNPQVHLVLNAGYEAPHLLAQVRAFAALPVADIIMTHLDEETRWGKLWNLVLGSNCPVRFLGAGQNIPGEFIPATPEMILSRQFPRKQGCFATQT